MLTWQQARLYHPNQRGIHQRRGEIISILARFAGEDRKYHDRLLAEDLMLYIGEGDLSAGPQEDTAGNRALKRAKETGAVFPVVVKWERNQYEYLGKWRVSDWEYSPWQGLPAHFRFWLKRVEAPEAEPARAQAVLSAQGRQEARRVSTVLERIVRDTAVIQELKALYRYTCQVCQQPLNRGFGDPLVQGHHLGIDIADLRVVHLRNVPPTPANYAQRSGRAGRRGDPALVLTYCSARSGHDQYFFRRREAMVAGAVKSPRLDLGNEDLVRAHVYAVWLAKAGLRLGSSIDEVIEVELLPELPLKEEVRAQIELSEARLAECLEEARQILAACGQDLAESGWYTEEWLTELLRNAPRRFDAAFDRWRELYRAAMSQLQTAQQVFFRSRRRQDQEEARRLQDEANRQRNLLLNETRSEETDFYPYRYLASEGFLPGYNFPRLPLRAFIPRKEEGEYISRPRFLALREFGPDNIVYHNGAKYEVKRFITPPGGLAQRRRTVKLCRVCGYFHEEATLDLCRHCGTRFDAETSVVATLLDMPSVRTRRRDRITCEEEERLRRGYRVTTHFRFAQMPGGQERRIEAVVYDQAQNPLLRLVYGPSATLYRVNHGWRHRPESEHFVVDLDTGEIWRPAPEGEEPEDLTEEAPVTSGSREVVRLMVWNTENLLLAYPLDPAWQGNEDFLASLQYALQRGMEVVFEVEESELASERLGEKEHRGVLYWEAAEGGVGVLRQLVQDPAALARVAKAALERCHFTAPQAEEDCARACYRCLLSYSNQPDHRLLDRRLVREALERLSRARTEVQKGGRDREEHYRWLRSLTDSRSELERRLVDLLYHTGRRLPDEAQKPLANYPCIPDFFYEPNVCVFCDGAVHDEPEQRQRDAATRAELRDLGYRVVVIRYDRDLEEQLQAYSDLFGEGRSDR